MNITQISPILKSYPVRSPGEEILSISGYGNSELWKKAALLSDFHYPWDKGIPPPTTFRALHNKDWLFCLFEVTDNNVHILRNSDNKWEVASSDRVEIFFRKDDKLLPYFCLEIDPLGRVLDYKAEFHRKFDITWSWPKDQLIIKTSQSEGGYIVELAIGKNSLRQLGLLGGNKLEAGLYRAECMQDDDPQNHMKWISWLKPASEIPDFHIPSSFGTMALE